MIVFFLVCAHRLYRSANRKISFDAFVLVIEAMKLILYIFATFIYVHQSMMVSVEVMQSSIQFLIAWSFTNKMLEISGY